MSPSTVETGPQRKFAIQYNYIHSCVTRWNDGGIIVSFDFWCVRAFAKAYVAVQHLMCVLFDHLHVANMIILHRGTLCIKLLLSSVNNIMLRTDWWSERAHPICYKLMKRRQIDFGSMDRLYASQTRTHYSLRSIQSTASKGVLNAHEMDNNRYRDVQKLSILITRYRMS